MATLILFKSPYSSVETVERLKSILKEKGVTVFALIDHSKAAKENGLVLADEVVVVFGDPKTGTFLMQENPEIGIELPLKILVWQNVKGETFIGYKDPLELGEKYQIKKNAEILAKMHQGLSQLVAKVIARS